MRAAAEKFKGIEYVRISNLPTDQKEKIKSSLSTDCIIKILKEGNLLDDCIQYADYQSWFDQYMAGPVYKPNQQAPAHGAYTFLTK